MKAFSSFFFSFSFFLHLDPPLVRSVSDIRDKAQVWGQRFCFQVGALKKEKSFVAWQAFCLLREGVKEISRKLGGLPAVRTQLEGGSRAPHPGKFLTADSPLGNPFTKIPASTLHPTFSLRMVFSAQSPGESALMEQVVTILVDQSPSEAAPVLNAPSPPQGQGHSLQEPPQGHGTIVPHL